MMPRSVRPVFGAGISQYLRVGYEVSEALERGTGVVSIESSIISSETDHHKLDLFEAVCDVIRSKGAIPALVAVVDGKICVGMNDDEVASFADKPNRGKLGRRDLAIALSTGQSGSTTVSSTIFCSSLADVNVAMTGAIGGVHRGFEHTLDVSADLDELSETRVAIVCAGAKIILDLPRTLEYLETKGVPVVGLGTDAFPAYFCMTDLPISALSSAAEVAKVMATQWSIGMNSGMLIAIPPSGNALPRSVVEHHLIEALASADFERVTGKAISPYLLKKLEIATEGLTARLRRQVALDVAAAAAEIACAFNSQKPTAGTVA
jgi:pseudouridine-5'-phosphate glycosidase